jgi:hypothetical protein
MSIVLRRVALGILVAAVCQGKASALEVESIVFESGSIGPAGSPAASGWQYMSSNINPDPFANAPEARIENVPSRTFQTGTNTEALVLHPWFFDNDSSFGHGAEWYAADDPGGSVQTVDPGEIVYLQMEMFSDFAGGGQYWKLASAVGFRGNGIDNADRGFNSEGVIGGNNRTLLSSVEADWTFDTQLNFNGLIKNWDKAQKQDQTRYLNPPTSEELDKTYLSTAIFRQGIDAATPFVGTETEVSEVLDNKNGGESSAQQALGEPTEPWGGNPNVITGLVIDRAQVNVLRGSGNAPGFVSRVSAHSNFIDPFETDENSPLYITNAVLGIKMFRFGVTDKTDINLDGVTNDLDKAIVMANLGATVDGDGRNGPTFFEGDIDNDLDVDADDLAFFASIIGGDVNNDGQVDGSDFLIGQRGADFPAFLAAWEPNFGSGGGFSAVPEPGSLLMVLCATAALAARHNRIGQRLHNLRS